MAWWLECYSRWALKGATNCDISLACGEWPSTRPVLSSHPFPMPHRPIGLCAMELLQFKAHGLVKVFDLFCQIKTARDMPSCKIRCANSVKFSHNLLYQNTSSENRKENTGRTSHVIRIGARRGVALEKQVEGLHKASGLDLR